MARSLDTLARYRNVLIRTDVFNDKIIVCEQRGWAGLELKDEVVLDVGGHIGSFSRLALDAQAKRVIVVEPEPDNFDVLTLNTQDERCERLDAAVVGRSYQASTIRLYRSSNPACHTTLTSERRQSIEVRAVRFADLLTQYAPTVVKMDIEGAEYGLLPELSRLPSSVRQLGMEVHLKRKDWREKLSLQLVDAIEHQGFVPRQPFTWEKGKSGKVEVWKR